MAKKLRDDPHNRRLDLFLQNIEFESEKRRQAIAHVEELAWDAVNGVSKPKLRLQK